MLALKESTESVTFSLMIIPATMLGLLHCTPDCSSFCLRFFWQHHMKTSSWLPFFLAAQFQIVLHVFFRFVFFSVWIALSMIYWYCIVVLSLFILHRCSVAFPFIQKDSFRCDNYHSTLFVDIFHVHILSLLAFVDQFDPGSITNLESETRLLWRSLQGWLGHWIFQESRAEKDADPVQWIGKKPWFWNS